MAYTAADIKKGLNIVIGILGLLLLLEFVNIVQVLVLNTLSPFNFIRLAMTLWICWAIYTGKLWARVMFSFLALISSLIFLVAAFDLGNGFFGLTGSIHLVCALALWILPPVNAYFEYVSAQV